MRGMLITGMCLAWASLVSGQSIEEGRQAYLQADFETAIATFESLLEGPTLTREQAADAHRYLTTLRTLQGQTDAAARHAAFAVALDPSVDPPQGSPDEVADLFASALESQEGPARLTIESDQPLRRGEDATVRARFGPAPEGLASVIELRCAAGGTPISGEAEPPEVELTLTAEGDAQCRATALTPARAVLASARETLQLVVETATTTTQTEESTGKRRAWPWVLVGLVIVAAAVAVPMILLRPFEPDDAQLGTTRIEGW